jgi:RNA polymerase sigma factor (sigma-70 family)
MDGRGEIPSVVDPRDDDAGRAPGRSAGRSDEPEPGEQPEPGEADGYAGAAEDAAWVEAARAGDERAFGRLFDRWFDPVYDVAWRIVRNADTAAEIGQDVFLAAWQGLDGLEQPGSFGGWVRRIARNRALNRLDRERRSSPDDERVAAALDRSAPDVDLTAALDERDQRELVWAAASALGERDASLLDLHLRHRLGATEIAEELGITTNNAHQLLHRLRGKLGGAIQAWVLWRGAGRDCPALDRAVAAAGITTFGADAVRVVGRHAGDCDDCADRQRLRLAPEALFAAMPVMVAPPLLRAEAAAALGQAGVPMAGSSALGPESSPQADGPRVDGPQGDAPPSDGPQVDDGPDASAGGHGPESPGDTDAIAPGDGPPAAGDAAPGARRSRLALVVLGAVVLLAVLGLAGALLAGEGDGGVETVRSGRTAPAPTSERSGTTTPSLPVAAPEVVDPAGPTTSAATVAPTPTAADGGAPDPVGEPDTGSNTTTTTTTTTTARPAPQPTISGFRVTPPGAWCGATPSAGTGTVTLTWQSLDADTATVTGPGGTTTGAASGSTTRCAASGDTFTLTVTGAGGTVDRTATVP